MLRLDQKWAVRTTKGLRLEDKLTVRETRGLGSG